MFRATNILFVSLLKNIHFIYIKMEIENKYKNGKIYKIINPGMSGLVYYGSTAETLKKRMSKHKGKHNLCCSKVLFEYGTAEIVLIENYPCNSRKELNRREGEYQLGNECINHNIAGRTKEECNKIHYQANKEKISEQKKIYRELNKEKLNEPFDCECGGKYTYNHKSRHIKSKKHQAFILSN